MEVDEEDSPPVLGGVAAASAEGVVPDGVVGADGISDKFRFRRNLSDAHLLAKARAFIDDIVPYKANFIAFGMPATFDTALNTAANAFEAAFPTVDTAIAEHIAGTATVGDLIRQAMVITRILDGIAKNVYATNPGQYATRCTRTMIVQPALTT